MTTACRSIPVGRVRVGLVLGVVMIVVSVGRMVGGFVPLAPLQQ